MRHRSPYQILVVDDEFAIRDAIVTYLQAKDYIAVGAENGVEALDCVKSRPFDLIILDLKMPYVDGQQFSEILVEEKIKIPILVITAVSIPIVIPQAVDYLLKGFHLETLERKMKNILKTYYTLAT